MSFRERFFLHTDLSAQDLAERVGVVTEVAPTREGEVSKVLLATEKLIGVPGEFGGPILRREPEWSHRPTGEWEASDAYEVEFRLWQAYGPKVDPSTGADLELRAASRLFEIWHQGSMRPCCMSTLARVWWPHITRSTARISIQKVF